MKFVISAVAAVLLAAPLCAQTMPAPAPAPAPAPVPATPADAAAATSKFSLDTPIEMIVADPAGKAVLDKDIPGMTTHPMYESFKKMSLTDLQPVSQGQLTDAQLAAAKADLAAIK